MAALPPQIQKGTTDYRSASSKAQPPPTLVRTEPQTVRVPARRVTPPPPASVRQR
jgi:hypothetical protein